MLNYRNVKSNLPKNIIKEHEKFFSKFRKQTITNLKVKTLKNVFVNQQGLVLKNALLVKGCAFNLIGNSDNTFYFSFWRKTLEQYLVCKFGTSLKSIKLNDDRRYVLIHSAWFNYSFWINSYLLRLITVLKSEDLTNLYLLYPEEWDSIPYVKESLDYFKIPIQRIPKDNHIFVRNLLMPETRMWTNSFDSFTIRYVYDWFSFLKESKKPIRRVYLTRKKRNVRCVANEDELVNLLYKFDFEVKSFEELSFTDQVKLMMQTEHFISIHGAGFSNVLFMQPRTSVMELINMEYANLEYTFPFWKLAESLGLNYYYQFGHIQNINVNQLIDGNYDSTKEYLVNQNIEIDLNLFEFNLKQMLVNSPNS